MKPIIKLTAIKVPPLIRWSFFRFICKGRYVSTHSGLRNIEVVALFMCDAELWKKTVEWLHNAPKNENAVYEELPPCESSMCAKDESNGAS